MKYIIILVCSGLFLWGKEASWNQSLEDCFVNSNDFLLRITLKNNKVIDRCMLQGCDSSFYIVHCNDFRLKIAKKSIKSYEVLQNKTPYILLRNGDFFKGDKITKQGKHFVIDGSYRIKKQRYILNYSLNKSDFEFNDSSTVNLYTTDSRVFSLSYTNDFNVNRLLVFENLNELDFFAVKVTNIEAILKIKKLQVLQMNYSPTIDFSFLDKMKNLQTLRLRGNNLTKIDYIKNLTSIQYLDISDNKLTDLKAVKKLNRLWILQASKNKINEIDSLSGLFNLASVNLAHNKIAKLSLFASRSLGYVDLSFNELKNIDTLKRQFFLRYLDISNNKIKSIPKLSSQLEFLDICYNPITSIKEVANLKLLNTLCFTNTKVDDISILKKLPNLEGVELGNLPLTNDSVFDKVNIINSVHLPKGFVFNAKNIEQLINVHSLIIDQHLSKSLLKELDEDFAKQINSIIIVGNLTNYNDIIKLFPNLEKIVFNESSFAKGEVIALEDIKSVVFYKCHIQDFTFFNKISDIINLDIIESKIDNFASIKTFKNVQKIIFNIKNVVRLEGLKELLKLTHLDIYQEQLSKEALQDLEDLRPRVEVQFRSFEYR